MGRGARAALGGAVVFALLLVAAVAAAVAAVGASQLRDDERWTPTEGPATEDSVLLEPVEVEAEVLDVDVHPGEEGLAWISADVGFTGEDGTTEVAQLDLGERRVDDPTVPEVGTTVRVAYERGEPDWVVPAEDGLLRGPGSADGDGVPLTRADDRVETESVVRRTTLVAGLALVAALVAGGLTLVLVRRAPEPERARWEG